MTTMKSARKGVLTDINVSITSIKFDSNSMSNTIVWSVDNPSSETILSFDVILFNNDTSIEHGSMKIMHEVGPEVRQYVHKNIEIISNGSYYKTYGYQIICYTDKTSKASIIEKFDPREIYECEPPQQISFTIKDGHVYFSIKCNENKFSTNIFIFRKHFDDDMFERIGVIPYRDNATFVDHGVSVGHFYEYRFMTYDLFGHFSQKIVKIDVRVWNKYCATSRINTLFDPIPIAEYAQESSDRPLIKLKITDLDSRCKWYQVRRRDITEKNQDFKSVPVGYVLANENNEEITLLDSIVRSGSYYEYSVFGQDKFGNSTDTRKSNPVYAGYVGSLPATLISLTSELINSYPAVMKLSWVDDNLNQELSDVVSGSSPLFPKDNLYYFKVFRRAYNELNYISFPEQSSSFIIDSCNVDDTTKTNYPYYQPPPPMRDTKYYYYVATYDALSNIQSNRSAEIVVDFTVPPSKPENLEIFFNPIFEPLKCLIRWKIADKEKTLDSFSVERIEEGGIWNKIGNSYFTTQFVDTSIFRNKKYLYRVVAIDFSGNVSDYSFISLIT